MQAKQKDLEDEMAKILDIVEDISEDDLSTHAGRNLQGAHLYNHISSKLEIIRSRVHRYRAKIEKLQNDVARLVTIVDGFELKKKNGRDNTELNSKIRLEIDEKKRISQEGYIYELKCCIKSKDFYISQLENRLKLIEVDTEKGMSSRISLNTDSSNVNKNLSDEFREKRISNESEGKPANYNEVLRDLREITSRASRALDQSNNVRKSSLLKTSHAHSSSPFIKNKDGSSNKLFTRKLTEETIRRPAGFSKQNEYERLKRKYSGISPFSPNHTLSKRKY